MNVRRWTPILLLLAAAPAAAQQAPELTEQAAADIAAFYNRDGTIHVSGETRVAPGTTVDGDVASLGGPLIIAGTVRGDVVVINGDVRIEPGGQVTGSVTIAGGGFSGDRAGIGGDLVVYREAMRFRQEDGRIIALGPARASLISAGRATAFGRTDFLLTVEDGYNRVEGLPVAFGPRIELGHSNPTVIDARLVYRTRSGLRIHPDEFGHAFRIEQFLGGHRSLAVGVAAERTIDPIERRLSDLENSLSTFILHRDYRDHYERHGWSAYIRYIGRTRPFEAGLELRDERHIFAEPSEPWALLENDEPWRPQPAIGEGPLRTARGWWRLDTRNERVDPSTGWLVEIEAEQGLEGELELRGLPDVWVGPVPPFFARQLEAEFTSIRVDARRYLRLGPRTRIAVRALAAGSPDDGPLPPQRQHVLGGEGSLPAFDRFELDCGARDVALTAELLGAYPYYGCDRQALFQAELRYTVGGSLGLGNRLGLDFDLLTTPEIVLFADAGRAWIEEESQRYRYSIGPSDFIYDAGVGIRLGRLGFYLAAPISDGGDVNFFIRLGPRI